MIDKAPMQRAIDAAAEALENGFWEAGWDFDNWDELARLAIEAAWPYLRGGLSNVE